MIGSFGFTEAVTNAEAYLVRELELTPLPLAPELAVAQGSWRGSPVELHARAYCGRRARYARSVLVRGGGLDIGNLLVLPAPEHALPILGADLVGFGKDTGVIVVDLSEPPAAIAPRPSSARRGLGSERGEGDTAARLGLRSAGELPAWAEPWFSPDVLFARVSPEQMPIAAAALLDRCEAFVELARESWPWPERADALERWQHAYSESHRKDDRGLRLLHKVFAPELADRVLREVLFPSALGSTAKAVA